MDKFPKKNAQYIIILTILVITSSLSLGFFIHGKKNITISIDENEAEVKTYCKTVEKLLASEDIQLEKDAYINVSPKANLENNMKIIIKTPKEYIIQMGDVNAKIISVYTKVEDILKDLDIELTRKDTVIPSLNTELEPKQKIEIVRSEEVLEVSKEDIPFEEVVNKNKNLAEGTKQVVQEGQNGVKEITIRKCFKNGELISEKKISEVIAKEPISKITEVGTKKKETTVASNSNEKSTGNNNTVSRGGNNFSAKSSFIAVATAYDLSPQSTGKRPGDPGYGITASGTKVRPGVVAVDPNVIPLGTRLYIESLDGTRDYGYAVAEDTGGAIKGNKIDLFFADNNAARRFGRRQVKVHILN